MHFFYPILCAKFEIEKSIYDFLKKVYEDKKLKEEEEKMYGAILGDMIGSSFEFDEVTKSKEFPLFGRWSQYTDDTVLTVAIAEALLDSGSTAKVEEIEKIFHCSSYSDKGAPTNSKFLAEVYYYMVNNEL